MVGRGETGAVAAVSRGQVPGMLVLVLCRDLPGRHRAPRACGSTNARALLSNGRALQPREWGSGAAHTCQL